MWIIIAISIIILLYLIVLSASEARKFEEEKSIKISKERRCEIKWQENTQKKG